MRTLQPSGYRAVERATLAGALVIVAGTAGYMAIEHVRLLDALYMTVITVTTIGFGEVFPLSETGRIFTIVLALAGVGVVFFIASEFARVIIEGDLQRLLGLRKDLKMVGKLDRHIIVCGYGRTGHAVADIFRQRKTPFVVIDQGLEPCQDLQAEGIPFVQGDASAEETLRSAGIERASTIIVCLPDDAHGVFTVLLARQLNPSITIIARAVEEQSEERLRMAGADRIINPYRIGGMRLAFTALKPTVVDFLDASLPGTGGELELAEVRISERSELANRSLAQAEIRKRFGLIVVALRRGQRTIFSPEPGTVIEPGDVLVALGPGRSIERIEAASH